MSIVFANTDIGSKRYVSGSGVVDSNGNCEIDFPSPPSGSYYTGSVTIFDSPDSAFWLLAVSGVNVDRLSGTQTAAGVQVGGQDQLKVTASNLIQFIGQTFHGTFACIITPADDTPLLIPGHDTFQSPAQTLPFQKILNTTIPAQGPGNTFIPIPPTSGMSLLGFVQILSGTADLIVQTDVNAGLLIGFVKLGADSAFTLWNIPALPDLNNLSIATSGAGGPDQVLIALYSLQQFYDIQSVISPTHFAEVHNGVAANSVVTGSPTFRLHAGSGYLSAELSTGLGVGAPSGPGLIQLQYYTGGGNWDNIANIGCSATVPADGKEIIVPPGTGRFQFINESSAANNMQADFTQ